MNEKQVSYQDIDDDGDRVIAVVQLVKASLLPRQRLRSLIWKT